jgi:hypothetical protein
LVEGKLKRSPGSETALKTSDIAPEGQEVEKQNG